MTLDEERHEQAAEWFSAQRRGVMSPAEREQFESWCGKGQNQAALDRMHDLWNELAGLKDLVQARAPPTTVRRPAWPLALAASLLVTVAGGAMWWQLRGRSATYTVQTAIGEQRSATLPDGSRVNVNVVTHLDYHRSSGRRDVKLVDGEALFFVHKDAAHPFIVRAGDYEVRAVGTAFNVRSRDGVVQVTMLEGVVTVEAVAGPQAGRAPAQLRQGERISLAAGSAGAIVEHVPEQAVAQWREHTESYENVPIAQIVEDMNRYFVRPLEVPDPALASRKVTLHLQVQVQDRERTLQTLSALLGTRIRNGDEADIIVGP